MAQLTGTARRPTAHASAFVVGGVLATAILTTGFAVALALGVRVELPGTASAPVVVRDAGAPAPIQPSVVGRQPYDGSLDPIERTYIFRSKAGHRLAPRPPTEAIPEHLGANGLVPRSYPAPR